jgi:parvulin-like peptidyl-prolyl isomerase
MNAEHKRSAPADLLDELRRLLNGRGGKTAVVGLPRPKTAKAREAFVKFPKIRLTRSVSLALAAIIGGVLVVAGQIVLRVVRPGPAAQSLAIVDGKPITLQAFQDEIARRGGEAAFSTPQQRRALLDDLIRVKVLASNAIRSGYSDDADVRRAIDQLLADKYQHTQIDTPLATLQVSEGDVQAYYQSHSSQFTVPASARAAIIFIAVPANASDDDKRALQDKAAKLRDQALAQPSASKFADLARQDSDDPETRAQGGDIGWVSEGDASSPWDPSVLKAVFNLDKPGDVSRLIPTTSGFYVVKLLEDKPASVRPLLEVDDEIRQQLVRTERQHQAAALYAAALANVQVSVNEAGVAAMEATEKAVVDAPHGVQSGKGHKGAG